MGSEGIALSFLTLPVDGSEWSVLRPCHFNLEKTAPRSSLYISVVFVHQSQTLHPINTTKHSCTWDLHTTRSQISSTSKWQYLDFNFQLEFLINNCNFICKWCFTQQENNTVLQHTAAPDDSSVWPKHVYYQCKQVNVVWHHGEKNHTVIRTLHKSCANNTEI